jgi:hypothetical protein
VCGVWEGCALIRFLGTDARHLRDIWPRERIREGEEAGIPEEVRGGREILAEVGHYCGGATAAGVSMASEVC